MELMRQVHLLHQGLPLSHGDLDGAGAYLSQLRVTITGGHASLGGRGEHLSDMHVHSSPKLISPSCTLAKHRVGGKKEKTDGWVGGVPFSLPLLENPQVLSDRLESPRF